MSQFCWPDNALIRSYPLKQFKKEYFLSLAQKLCTTVKVQSCSHVSECTYFESDYLPCPASVSRSSQYYSRCYCCKLYVWQVGWPHSGPQYWVTNLIHTLLERIFHPRKRRSGCFISALCILSSILSDFLNLAFLPQHGVPGLKLCARKLEKHNKDL